MASVAAIRSVGTSLADFLNRTYQEQKNEELNPAFAGVALPNCVFNIISSGRIQEQDDPSEAAVSVFIFLYRVSIDPHLRNSGRLSSPDMLLPPLSVALHYLFTFWSNSAENECVVLAWTMLQLEPAYRLSLGYVARVVRIEPEEAAEQSPVIATRFNYAVPADTL